ITVNETPAVPSVNRLTRASCVGSTSTVSVLDPGTGLEISWEVVAAPAGASFMAGDVLDANVDGLDYRTDLDANGMRLRIKGAMSVAVGTYQFKAKAINSATGCESELTTEILEINIFAQPTVDISADPDGDLCLGQLDVMYDATITSTDGGTYTYDWCAYNSGDGSGTCFGGFDDNTIQMPKRSWTSSAGPKSVGVTVMSDVQGCMATDLYSFEVVAPTMLACPANQTVTLITDDVTFDCLAEATFNNPTIIPGPCDPVILTISVDGGAPETVIAGEPYTASFMELGMFTVTYDSEDAVGNTSTCSFDISVDGLPCGLVDNGGVGCNTSTSMFDQDTETFSLTSDCAPNTMLYTEDQTAFVFTELCGDGEIIAQVTGISGTGFAGVMLRESEMADAKKMALGTNTVDRLRREVRVIDGYPSSAAEILSLNQFWIRITRSGDVFSAFASTDGVFWQPYLSQVIIMGGCIRAGLYTYSEKVGNPVTAIFTDVSITGLASLANLGAPIAIGVQGLSEGLSLESEEGLRIYPNPTKGELNVNLSNFFGAAVDIRIFNSVGQIVQREQLEEVQVAVERFDVSRLNAGMYNVVVKVGETIWTERVVIMK
ncbi:MAG: T9SS type A sorting domain-containing protein, partial [Bacteroidota bacterium]